MIENKKVQNKLLIMTILIIVVEILIFFLKEKIAFIDIIYNILLGIVGSSIVSYIIAIIAYKYKKEEKMEELTKSLLEIYSKMVMFKCSYNECDDKNKKIVELQSDINDYIGIIRDIEYDLVYKLKIIKNEDTIFLKKYNDKMVDALAEGIECKNNKFV